MISSRKRAGGNTGCPVSFLGGRANPSPRLAALIVILLLAAASAFAAPRQKEAPRHRGGGRAADAPRRPAREAAGRGEEADVDAGIPVHISRLETPDGPYIVATIGDFPTDLDGRRQEFLGREFFENFAGEVFGIGDPGATLKIAMLPQEREDRRECDFTFGKLSGHMIVLVQKRRVMVVCSFAEAEGQPKLLAGARGPAGARLAG
jgi:hypothetical protein